jgi:hypothetical protein
MVVTYFFKVIANSWSFSLLMEMSVNGNGKPIPRLFLLTRGTRTEDKNEVINACVLVYGLSLKKKAYHDVDIFTLPKESAALSQPQPLTISKNHPILFEIRKRQQCQLWEFKNEA